jgi:hypothetical protein
MMFQCIGIVGHVTLHFNNISKTPVFWISKKPLTLLDSLACYYKLPKLHFSASIFKLIGSCLSNRKSTVTVDDDLSVTPEMQTGVSQRSILVPSL